MEQHSGSIIANEALKDLLSNGGDAKGKESPRESFREADDIGLDPGSRARGEGGPVRPKPVNTSSAMKSAPDLVDALPHVAKELLAVHAHAAGTEEQWLDDDCC